MSNPVTKPIYIAMNEGGDIEAGVTADETVDLLRQHHSGRLSRVVSLTVIMTPPAILDGGAVAVPDDAGSISVSPANDR
jgi:predicted 2-oxoglutarate/Fe(II)-dependent dioxygenase YbiX